MFGRKKKVTLTELEAFKADVKGMFEKASDLFDDQERRIVVLEGQVRDLEANKKSTTELMKKTTALLELHQKRVEALEAKVAELEAKRVPVISDLTGIGKKEKPASAKQIIDEWFNGKAEGGEGK